MRPFDTHIQLRISEDKLDTVMLALERAADEYETSRFTDECRSIHTWLAYLRDRYSQRKRQAGAV